jgi:hypothetical protein
MTDNAKTQKKVNYLFDDLSQVSTEALKKAMGGYNLLLKNPKRRYVHQKAKDIMFRIEGELLSRKEFPIR